jgi:hypothetical protein
MGEISSNAGGLIRWPVKILLPLGFFLLSLQGILRADQAHRHDHRPHEGRPALRKAVAVRTHP